MHRTLGCRLVFLFDFVQTGLDGVEIFWLERARDDLQTDLRLSGSLSALNKDWTGVRPGSGPHLTFITGTHEHVGGVTQAKTLVECDRRFNRIDGHVVTGRELESIASTQDHEFRFLSGIDEPKLQSGDEMDFGWVLQVDLIVGAKPLVGKVVGRMGATFGTHQAPRRGHSTLALPSLQLPDHFRIEQAIQDICIVFQGAHRHRPDPSRLHGFRGLHGEIQLGDAAHRSRRLQRYGLLVERETMLEKVDRPDPIGSVAESAIDDDVEPVAILEPLPVVHERFLEARLVFLRVDLGADLLDERRLGSITQELVD